MFGAWTKNKLEILNTYLDTYLKMIRGGKGKYFQKIFYIDGFAGPGEYLIKDSTELTRGSPLIALDKDVFTDYWFIEKDKKNYSELKASISKYGYDRTRAVNVIKGDANKEIPKIIDDINISCKSWRGLCFIDPYGSNTSWNTVIKIGNCGKLDLIIYFPILSIQRIIGHKRISTITDGFKKRFHNFMGLSLEEIKGILFEQRMVDLFNGTDWYKKTNFESSILNLYKQRLSTNTGAGYKFVSEPLPHNNSTNSRLYYIFLAAHAHPADNLIEWANKKFGMKQNG